MSETNGKPEDDWRQRFDRLERSHVQLMTDHEMFRREHDEFTRRYDAQREQDRIEQKARDERIDGRIETLVSAIGRLIAAQNSPFR